MKLAAIDLGSNSVKLCCADVKDQHVVIQIDRETLSRVGEGLDRNARLLDAAIERTMKVLAADVAAAKAFGAERIACVATAGLRGAANASALIDRAKKELGLEIEVIGGEREAELAFEALVPLYGDSPFTVIDIGGRSTEVIGRRGAMSLELGSVRMTERHLLHDIPTDAELAAMRADIDAILVRAPEAEGDLFGVSGTALAMASFEQGVEAIEAIEEGLVLHERTIRDAYRALRAIPAQDRLRGTAIPLGRNDVIVAGAAILLAILGRYGRDRMRISTRSLRHALLTELASGRL
jgi:exopolyphosphatase / guanosine-5'-triphosphate,3'-diphosphate pyrophosphatase